MATIGIPLAALIISLVTFWATQARQRQIDERSATKDDIADLREQNKTLVEQNRLMREEHREEFKTINERLAICESARQALITENISLMRKALGL